MVRLGVTRGALYRVVAGDHGPHLITRTAPGLPGDRKNDGLAVGRMSA